MRYRDDISTGGEKILTEYFILKNQDTCVSWPDAQKSLEVHCEKQNRKPAILDFVAFFYIFTLTNLYQGFHQINFILR